MSRVSISDLLWQQGIDDPAAHTVAGEADYRIGLLESRLADLEAKLQTAKIVVARLAKAASPWACVNHGQACPVCGALGDEPCDAGLHG